LGDWNSAQFRLDSYLNSYGMARDLVEAHAWFNIASAQGNKTGKRNLSKIEKEMTEDQLAEATKLAREYFEKYGKKK